VLALRPVDQPARLVAYWLNHDNWKNDRMDRMANSVALGRARGVTVAVEGFFAFMWFGWGQAAAPAWLVVPLAVGTGLAALVAVTGVVITARSTGRLAAFSDRAVRRQYGITVGVEFSLIGAGAATLGATGQGQWIPAWVCVVVGAHFFPLARVLANRSLRLLGALLGAVAAAAIFVGVASTVAPSTITGPGAGLCLLAFSLGTLLAGGRPHHPTTTGLSRS
jgi:hypothetical protein